jgi:hypothetical protein
MIETNDGFAQSVRNCFKLLDGIFEKFCGPKNKPAPPSAPLTDEEMERLADRGIARRTRCTHEANAKKMRSIFSKEKPQGGRPINPAMVAAVKELWALERTGKKMHGDGMRIARKHGVRYFTLMERISIERTLAKAKQRRKAA